MKIFLWHQKAYGFIIKKKLIPMIVIFQILNHLNIKHLQQKKIPKLLPPSENPGDTDQPAQPSEPTLGLELSIPLKYICNFRIVNWFSQGFKITLSWNEYRSEITTQLKNSTLDYIIHGSFGISIDCFFFCLKLLIIVQEIYLMNITCRHLKLKVLVY